MSAPKLANSNQKQQRTMKISTNRNSIAICDSLIQNSYLDSSDVPYGSDNNSIPKSISKSKFDIAFYEISNKIASRQRRFVHQPKMNLNVAGKVFFPECRNSSKTQQSNNKTPLTVHSILRSSLEKNSNKKLCFERHIPLKKIRKFQKIK